MSEDKRCNYTARIIDTATGDARDYRMENMLEPEDGDFWWTEGNFACDCNRGASFLRASGVEVGEDDFPDCNVGPNRYRVPYLMLDDGRKVLIDEAGRG